MTEKHQTEILELKKSMNEMKNARESLCIRADQIKEQICALKDRNFETTQEKKKRTSIFKKQRKPAWTMGIYQNTNIRIIGVPEGDGGREFI